MKKQPTINPNDFVSVESGSEDVYVPLNEEIDVYDVDKAIDEVNGVVVAGSTEDKVEYLDETKTDIREAIINQGVEVGEDDPFRLYAEKIGEIEGGEIHNQDKTITENGTYTYDEGYTGLGEVVVEVPSEEPVLETLNVVENGTYTPSGNVDGYDEVVVDVPEATLGELSVTENGVYEPTSVDGYNRVEVDVNPPLQDKTITNNGTYTADSGYYGLDEVTVDVDIVNNQDKTITENGTYTADSGYTGLGTVVVNTPVVNNENKTIRVNGTYTAGAGYTGLGEVVVDVADIPAVVEPLSVSPTTSQQIITPPANVDGFNQVNVGAVTSSIDENITAGNIKSGVSILGVQGNVVELDGETTTVSPTTSQQVITPTGQHNGLTEVTIEAVDASIDSNITSGNIVDGVTILGVSGSAVELNADSLSVTPTTSAQTITPTSPYNAFNEVSVSAVDASIDANIVAGNIKSGVTILGVSGDVEELSGGTASVTPTTSSQVITPTSPVNGFTRVEVDAVDSSIDANIQSANIVDGVSILGVTGSAEVLDGEQITITPTTSQQVITPSGNHNGITEATVSAVTSAIDGNIVAGNIKSGVSILGVNGSCVELNAESTTLSPTISAVTVYPTSPYNALSSVTVEAVDASIDSNIVAGNIKEGVTILGVAGTYTGSGPVHYIEKSVDVNGKLINTTNLIDFTGVQEIGDYVLCGQYYTIVFPANTNIDMSSITTIDTSGCERMFGQAQGIVSVDLSGVTEIGPSGCSSMFVYSSVSSADLSALVYVKDYGCSWMFGYSDLSGIIDLGAMTTLDGNSCCSGMFSFCSGVTGAVLTSLSVLNGRGVCSGMFQGTSVATLSFPALKSTSFGSWMGSSYYYYTDQFNGMLRNVTGCTVHFPSNLQVLLSGWTDVQNGFAGTNTTVLFDLPATEPTINGTLLTHYQRNAFGDTQNALAWNETSQGSSTYYYTSGTSMPSVGASIYSNAACTTQVDTIASIS